MELGEEPQLVGQFTPPGAGDDGGGRRRGRKRGGVGWLGVDGFEACPISSTQPVITPVISKQFCFALRE